MKKFLVIIAIAVGIFITFNQNVISWVKSSFSSDPAPYYQQRLEFFENLSCEYYGMTDYAKELEMVNRLFVLNDMSTDRIELIIPSQGAIIRLKERQSLASIENQPGTQIVKRIRQLSNQAAGTKKVSESIEPSKSSMLILLIGIIHISTAVALFSYFKYRNRTKKLDMTGFLGDESIQTDKSILANFDAAGFEEKINSQIVSA